MSDPMSNRLAQPDFWNRQLAERMAEMAEIRAAGPFARTSFINPLTGETEQFYGVTRYADVVEISKRPHDFCSGKGAVSVPDMPEEALNFFGSFINMDDLATPASAASSPGRLRPVSCRACWIRSRRSVPR